MKKVLSLVLVLSLMLSLSVVAFAAGSGGVKPEDVILSEIPLTEGVSGSEGAEIKPLAESSEPELAQEVVAGLENQGVEVVSGFVVEGRGLVEITLPDLEAGMKVFVDGSEVVVPANHKILVVAPCIIIIGK